MHPIFRISFPFDNMNSIHFTALNNDAIYFLNGMNCRLVNGRWLDLI